jgi:hypothetical protein
VEKAEMEGCLLAMRHGGLSRHRISQVTGITLLLGEGSKCGVSGALEEDAGAGLIGLLPESNNSQCIGKDPPL